MHASVRPKPELNLALKSLWRDTCLWSTEAPGLPHPWGFAYSCPSPICAKVNLVLTL